MQMRRAAVLLMVASLGAAPAAWGWGDQGHQIICALAMEEMQPSTRAKVRALAAADRRYNTFAESCVWPDHPKQRRPEHFVNVPRDASAIQDESCPEASACLFTAIAADSAVLRDHASTKSARLRALKFLGHWMGDLHQPLHVSFADDRGGNSIRVTGLCTEELHATWDRCLVSRELGDGNPFTIARKLAKEIDDADRTAWKSSGIVGWANESFQIAIDPASLYCVEKNGVCQYDATHRDLGPHQTHRTVKIDEGYVDTNGPIVRERIKRAGVRLAKLLDDLFAAP